jgi:60 kDa SS-A/Ro ribonucleoprotein
MQKYTKHYSTKKTSQQEKIPGKTQVKNNAGGYVFAIDPWQRLHRFLILGTDGGTYYASERALTIENAECVRRCIETDGPRTVALIAAVSTAGRAPKNDPALFALAMCTHFGDLDTRRLAFDALPAVARIGTHLFHFVAYREAFAGWGRGMRRAAANWYLDKPLDALAYQIIKYQQRDGWSHRDVLRLGHPKPPSAAWNAIFKYAVSKADTDENLPRLIHGFESAQYAPNPKTLAMLIRDYSLTREMIPTQFLTESAVWDALLEKMPLTAMIRNLGNLSKVGLLKPLAASTRLVAERLADTAYLHKSRVHPIQLLAARMTYAQGHGVRGRGEWTPVPQVVDALDAAFYLAFDNVEPTDKRFLLGIDVSGSMTMGEIAGVPGLTPNVAAAAMAMVAARTEPAYYAMGFADTFRDLGLTAQDTLSAAMRKTQSRSFGRTNCALPMQWALKHKIEADVFVVYTDNETWFGEVHPVQALQEYRRVTGIDAKLIVCAMTPTRFSIADPADGGCLDVVGFDTATPSVISAFVRGGD